MAGNRLRFQEAMQKANDFGWAEEWDAAVKLYQRALAELPDNDSALIGYAWALLNNDQLDEALDVYKHLTKVVPADPGPYERSAEILEQRARSEEAADAYIEAARRYAKQGLATRQTTALESAVRMRPQNTDVWDSLLQLYRAQNERQKAVHAVVWLSFLLQDQDRDRAIALCREVQSFASQDPRVGQTIILLQSNRRIPKPPPVGAEAELVIDGDLDTVDAEAAVYSAEDGGTPVEIARQRALTKLAESIFAEDRAAHGGPSDMAVDLLISRAVEAQTQGDVGAAVQHYEELVDTGVSMSSVHFNLGLLYKEQMHFDEAIAQFDVSKTDPEYVLGSHFSLGECFLAQGEFQQAMVHFLEAVKVVDIATIEREHVDDLIRVYEGLAQSLVNTGEPQRAEQVSEMLVDFLGRRGWEDSAVKARKRLDDLARMGTVLSLAELISMPGSEDILRSIARAQEYQRRNRIYLALEEVFQALSVTPDYLPLHHLLGILLRENGHLEEATDKFLIVAETYDVRGQIPQALATYELILDMSPLSIPVHRRVVELLTQHGRIDEALLQYLQLADAYYQLAQPDQARDVYTEALRLAPRGTSDKGWEPRILHRMADLDVQRLDWLAAIEDNEAILRVSPDDERAHLALYRLYPRTNRQHLGTAALDNLIKQYIANHKVTKALTILEDLVATDPDSIPLRIRIAQLYLNLGRRDEALQHLDILGDLQLEAGYRDAAIKTIEAILALSPANREAYADLYRELAGREPPEPNP